MAHLAQINGDSIVINVIVVPDSVTEETAQDYGSQFGEGRWVLTSYNDKFRRVYAGIGSVYREDVDAFQPLRPFKGWVFIEEKWNWEPPVPMPSDAGWWGWNEEQEFWEKIGDVESN